MMVDYYFDIDEVAVKAVYYHYTYTVLHVDVVLMKVYHFWSYCSYCCSCIAPVYEDYHHHHYHYQPLSYSCVH